MMAYAEGTTVSADRSRTEIAGVIRKHGATGFLTGEDDGRAVVAFVSHGRQIRFTLRLPTDPKEFARTTAGRSRSAGARRAAMDGETRRLWRALLIVIKSKFEVVESGIETFEEAFLAQTVLPDGGTVSERLLPRIDHAIETGTMPQRLLAIEAGDR